MLPTQPPTNMQSSSAPWGMAPRRRISARAHSPVGTRWRRGAGPLEHAEETVEGVSVSVGATPVTKTNCNRVSSRNWVADRAGPTARSQQETRQLCTAVTAPSPGRDAAAALRWWLPRLHPATAAALVRLPCAGPSGGGQHQHIQAAKVSKVGCKGSCTGVDSRV